MFSEGESIFTVTNEQDHETQHAQPKQVGSLLLQSPGRFTVNLSRIPIAQSHQQIHQTILEQLGLEEEQLDPQTELLSEANQLQDLSYVFGLSKITLNGDVGAFKTERGIGSIVGVRCCINDGNTVVHHFWDNAFHYLLLHEIKY